MVYLTCGCQGTLVDSLSPGWRLGWEPPGDDFKVGGFPEALLKYLSPLQSFHLEVAG